MNFIAGVIIGILVSVGGAYIHDASVGGTGDEANPRAIVNWPVLTTKIHNVSRDISDEWAQLTGKPKTERD